jgi:hypothetical protein
MRQRADTPRQFLRAIERAVGHAQASDAAIA